VLPRLASVCLKFRSPHPPSPVCHPVPIQTPLSHARWVTGLRKLGFLRITAPMAQRVFVLENGAACRNANSVTRSSPSQDRTLHSAFR
jgi:hypothetical protein